MRKRISYDVPIAVWEPSMRPPSGTEYMRLEYEVVSEEEYFEHIEKRDNPALGVKNFMEEELPDPGPELNYTAFIAGLMEGYGHENE